MKKWYKVMNNYIKNERGITLGGSIVYLNEYGMREVEKQMLKSSNNQLYKILKEFSSYEEMIKYENRS